jgi:uncharacterized protein (TIGR00290 family)
MNAAALARGSDAKAPLAPVKQRVLMSWSGGKDSALALRRIANDRRYEVVALLCMCNQDSQRVCAHGVPLALVEAQARALDLPLEKVLLSARSSNDEYLEKLAHCLRRYQLQGIVFGDIFLEDLRQWRERTLAALGLQAVFPLWKADSGELMREFLEQRFQAAICCVDDRWLGEDAVGRTLDAAFVRALPAEVDACGENGEYHSFVFAGPLFHQPVSFAVGNKYYQRAEALHQGLDASAAAAHQRWGHWFCELLPR